MTTDETELSDDVSDTAKAAQDVDKALGSPMALLLGPTFKLIGEHWGKKTDAYLNLKQVENLEDKIAIAQENGPLLLGSDTKPRQIAALMEWTDAAHDVDGDEQPQLSQAWGKALRDIAEQNYILLDSLAKLNEDDIKILKDGGMLSKEQLAKFTRIGLIKESTTVSLAGYVFFVLAAMILIALTAALGFVTLMLAMQVVFEWPQSTSFPSSGWALLILAPFFLSSSFLSRDLASGLWREFVKGEDIAVINVRGHDVIFKLDSGAEPKFYYNKRDLAKEKRRSNLWNR